MQNLAPTPTPLDNLCAQLEEAKRQEQAIKLTRADIEAQIADCMSLKEEGTTHEETAYYRATVTTKVNRTIDQKAAAELLSSAAKLGRTFRTEHKLDLRIYKALDDDDKATLSDIVTSKPGKPSVKVERVTA